MICCTTAPVCWGCRRYQAIWRRCCKVMTHVRPRRLGCSHTVPGGQSGHWRRRWADSIRWCSPPVSERTHPASAPSSAKAPHGWVPGWIQDRTRWGKPSSVPKGRASKFLSYRLTKSAQLRRVCWHACGRGQTRRHESAIHAARAHDGRNQISAHSRQGLGLSRKPNRRIRAFSISSTAMTTTPMPRMIAPSRNVSGAV